MRDTATTTPNRVMIVTGASSGIGRALALAAARERFDVVLCARRSERLADVAWQIAGNGGRSAIVVADVRDEATAQRLVATAREQFGRIDVIAPFAGSALPGTLLQQGDDALDAQWRTHVIAPLQLARAALPSLRTSCGQIMLIGSGLARTPAPGYGAYAPAKAAIRAAAAQLRRELRAERIAVIYVDPGAVATEFSQASGLRPRAAGSLRADANVVARRILRATVTRPRRINAVPWQTAAVVLGEWLPTLADYLLTRFMDVPDTEPITARAAEPTIGVTAAPTVEPATSSNTETIAMFAAEASTDASAVAEQNIFSSIARRMERANLSPEFVARLLVPGSTLTLQNAAMQWVGMPNKHERALLRDVFELLTAHGYATLVDIDTWRIERPLA